MLNTKICPKTKETCIGVCGDEEQNIVPVDKSFSIEFKSFEKWIRVKTVADIYKIFRTLPNDVKYMLVAGHTSDGKNLFTF